MADQFSPTYRVTDQSGVTHYTCIVEDASRPGGVCDHDATDFELFTMHMEQRHAGTLIEEPPARESAAEAEDAEEAPEAEAAERPPDEPPPA
jgi:hypothetical protein